MTEIPPEVEQQLRDMDEGTFAALTARVRAPDTAEQFREIAKAVVPEHVLDEFVRGANVAAFVSDGKLDEPRIRQHLGTMFGQQAGRDWGQGARYSGSPGPGAKGRAEAERRQNKPAETTSAGGVATGAQGRAEAERRKNRGTR